MVHTYFNDLYRKFVFWLGRVHTLSTFPFFTWDARKPSIEFEEIDYVKGLVQPGDIGLHRNDGYLSNTGIPGKYKHAWLFTDDGRIIEATAEGVREKSHIYPCLTDNLMVIRPKLSEEDRKAAVEQCRTALGMSYDVDFKFDLADEFAHLNKYDQSFSCIELVLYSYYKHIQDLKVQKMRWWGKDIYKPDCVLTDMFEVIYQNDSGKRVLG